MSDKLQRRAEEGRRHIETEINENLAEYQITKFKEKSLIRLGAISAVGRIAQTLTAQTIRGLQTVRDEKDFEALGFSRFDDFLDESEISPMSYRQFNDREKLLLSEGDQVFDLLNSLNLSHRKRRLLGAGNVQIDETAGTVIIKTGEDETEEEIELNDRTRLLQILSAVTDQAANQNAKINKQQEKIQKGEKEVENLRRKLDESQKRPGETKIFDVWLSICNLLTTMTELVKKADASELAHGELYLDPIRRGVDELAKAYRQNESEKDFQSIAKSKLKKNPANDDLADVIAQTSDEELADLME